MARRPDPMMVEKRKDYLLNNGLYRFGGSPSENHKNDRSKYLDFARKLKSYGTWKRLIPIVIGTLGTVPKGLVGVLEELKSRDHPNIAEIG